MSAQSQSKSFVIRRAAAVAMTALCTCACGGGGGGSGGGADSASNPAFTVQSTALDVFAPAGTARDVAIEVAAAGPLTAPVTFALRELPAGLAGAFVPPSLSGPGTTTLRITAAASAPVGPHAITVAATSGASERSFVLLVLVVPPSASGGLALRLPQSLSMRPGATTAVLLEIARDQGATGAVALSTVGAPAGLSLSFDHDPTPQATSLLSVQADGGIAPGVYPIAVHGALGERTGSTGFLVEVVASDAPADRWISRVDLGHAHLATGQRLVTGKPALLRAQVLADAAGVVSPVVRVTGTLAGGKALGAIELAGPATLPTAEDPATLLTSFAGELPADWIDDGLELTVSLVGSADRTASNDSLRVVPSVVPTAPLDLVLVPLVLGGRTGTALDCSAALLAYFPIADVRVSVRAPHAVGSVDVVMPDGKGWNQVLAELAELREADNSDAYYYGLLDLDYVSGVSGTGYIGQPVAIGRDSSIGTLVHELGHNLGLRHAPCGGATGADGDFPFPLGITGSWGWDARYGLIYSPTLRYDIMSYCGPPWISAYHYEKVRSALAVPAPAVAGLGVVLGERPMLSVHGSIDRDGRVTLRAVRRRIAVPRPQTGDTQAGELELHAVFAGGSLVERFTPYGVGCDDRTGVREFVVGVADPGDLRRLEIRRCGGGGVLHRAVAPATGTKPEVRCAELGGVLTVTWNASGGRTLSVVHVGARRTALALELTGGRADLATVHLPRGGEFELATSGLDGSCERVRR